jgi:putative cell wall-binding protein
MPLGPSRACAAGIAPYVVGNASKDAIFMEMAIRPQAIYRNGVTYVAYQGPDLDPWVMAYDHAARSWLGPVRAGINSLKTDTHGAPALYIDAAGYIHVFFGGHYTPLLHSRSVRPGDISSFTRMPDIAAKFTYPQVFTMPDGRVGLFYRGAMPNGPSPSSQMEWQYRTSSDGGNTWSSPVLLLTSPGDQSWYASVRNAPDGRVQASFVRLDVGAYFAGSWARYDVHYLEMRSDGIWQNASGAPAALPVTWSNASQCLAEKTAPTYANMPIASTDASGHPVVLFSTGTRSGPGAYTWKAARFENGTWTSSAITTTDHFFDAGTLDSLPDGTMRAYVVSGGSSGADGKDRSYGGRGGSVMGWTSIDGGKTWHSPVQLDPAEPYTLYNHPQIVLNGRPDARLIFTEWTNGPTLSAMRLYLRGDGGFIGRQYAPGARRVWGADRYSNAVQVSRLAFPSAAPCVVLASGQAFADSLAGAPLAYAKGAPLLLVDGKSVRADVRAEIARLRAKDIIILGGTKSVDQAIAADVKRGTRVTTVRRIAGADRYETAARIASELAATSGHPASAFVVAGDKVADGISAGPVAAINAWPVLLVKRDAIPDSTAAAIRSLGVTSTIIVGGEASVSAATQTHLPASTRISGANRYAVAAAVAEFGAKRGLLPLRAIVATGESFPDALTAGVAATRFRAPVLLTTSSRLSDPARMQLGAQRPDLLEVFAVGGRNSISDATLTQVRAAAGVH